MHSAAYVLAHEHISLSTELETDSLCLLRANHIHVHQEQLGVLLEQVHQLGEVSLLLLLRRHIVLCKVHGEGTRCLE